MCARGCPSGEPQAKHCALDHIPTSRALRRAHRQSSACHRGAAGLGWISRSARLLGGSVEAIVAMNGASGELCCVASSRLPSAGIDRRRGAADLGAVLRYRPDPKGRRRGSSMPAATSAPGLRSPLPRLHWVWAHPAHHVCLVARPSLRRRSRRNFARRSARRIARRPSYACATALWCRSAPWPLICWSWFASLACRWRCRSSRS